MNTNHPVGIDAISFYVPHFYIELSTIAAQHGISRDYFKIKLGQEKMAVPPPGEDIITMAANAARTVLKDCNRDAISLLLFATESGIDQSKAGGIHIHKLLGLPSRCRIVELKQACYSATVGMQLALPLIQQNPQQKALLIASDIARYGLGTAGEPTQGAGAVAMVISAAPKILTIASESGYYTDDIMDFWRPNYRDEALVDGRLSIKTYLHSLLESWQHYQQQTNKLLAEFSRFCYHLPFSQIAEMAHLRLTRANGLDLNSAEIEEQISPALIYNRLIGNSYAASLYIALSSLLDHTTIDLSNHQIGFFSYGSGCVAEFFCGTVMPGYQQYLHTNHHCQLLDNRTELNYQKYREFYHFPLPIDGSSLNIPDYPTGHYRLHHMAAHKRHYIELK